uniref:Uncharacterized protein n=1 Tax=Octactis speculum TaxID=3111310 RepID=A0A7S2H6G9_9STRA
MIAPGLWSRRDAYDIGAEYRAVVGLPGGLDGPHGTVLRRANTEAHNMTLVTSLMGSDGDTLGLGVVYVMDANNFPALQAELCMQFLDDPNEVYPPAYHALKSSLVASGRIVETSCPPNYVC